MKKENRLKNWKQERSRSDIGAGNFGNRHDLEGEHQNRQEHKLLACCVAEFRASLVGAPPRASKLGGSSAAHVQLHRRAGRSCWAPSS